MPGRSPKLPRNKENRPQPNLVAQVIRNLMLQPPAQLAVVPVRAPTCHHSAAPWSRFYMDKSAITDQLIEDIRRPSSDPGAAMVFASVFSSPRQGGKGR